MIIWAADEQIFILTDQIIDHIYSFFPPSNDHDEKTGQACAALRALITVIGVVVSEMDCWDSTTIALERSFAQMLKEVPSIRAELEREQRPHSIN
jgi:hypothetical protein